MLLMGSFRLLLMTTFVSVVLVTTGCAARLAVGYRVYDPYRADYHVWDDREGIYYNQWIVETHRPHRDLRKLPSDEQSEYWKWRHDHH